jgi:hypothetical protein
MKNVAGPLAAAVACVGPSAYISAAFPVIVDAWLRLKKAGGAQRRITDGDRAPDAEGDRR